MDQSPVVHALSALLHGLIPTLGSGLHSEALSFAVDVAQTQVDVGADALHRLYGQRAAQVLSIGPGGGQAETKPAGWEDKRRRI